MFWKYQSKLGNEKSLNMVFHPVKEGRDPQPRQRPLGSSWTKLKENNEEKHIQIILYKCSSRQRVRLEQRRGQGPWWQETTYYADSRGPGQTKKSLTLQTDRKPHVVNVKCPGGKGERGLNPQLPKVTCSSLCPYYNTIIIKLATQIRSSHHAPTPWHFWSKLNKDKNLPSLWEGEAGMKIKE